MSEPSTIENSSVLITGATGFIGSHLTDHLLSLGCRVHCLIRKTSGLPWLDRSRVHLHTVDLTQPGFSGDFLPDIQYVFHCAGRTQAKTRKEYNRINADACAPLYETCAAKGKRLKTVVHLSSLAAVGPATLDQPVDENSPCNPLTFYGHSKLAGEKIAQRFSSTLPMLILRPPVVYGPREKNFFTYLQTIHRGLNLRVGKTRRLLSLIYVKDLVRAMVRAATQPIGKENVFFVTDGNIYSWEEVNQTATRILDVRTRAITIPEKALPPMALLCELAACLRSKPALLDRQRALEMRQDSWAALSTKFFNHFEYQPQYDLNRGLTETLEWYKNQRWL